MKIKTRSVIAFAAVIAMILSLGLFTACGEEKDVSIKLHVKLTSATGDPNGELDENDLVLTGIASELTVLAATQRMCVDVLALKFDYDTNAVKRIGSFIGGLYEKEYGESSVKSDDEEDGEAEDAADPEEDGEEEEEEAVKEFYYDWVCTVNGAEAKLDDIVKEGDNIIWNYQEVKREFVDKTRN